MFHLSQLHRGIHVLIVGTILLLKLTAVAADRSPSTKILWSTDWSANDHYLAVGGENILEIYDGRTHELHSWNAPEISDTARFVQWHDSKPLLAVSTGPDDTGIYDVENGEFIPLKTTEGTRGVAWNFNHTKLATAGNDGALQIWNPDGTLLHRYKAESGKSLTGVAWHPKKDIIVTIGEFITVHRGDAHPIKQWSHWPGDKGLLLLLSVQWHPSGEFFVVGDYGNPDTKEPPVLQFWSKNFELIQSIEIEDGAEFRNIDWNDSGTRLATASDKLRIWDQAGKLLHEGAAESVLWGVKWSQAEDKILTSSIEEEIDLWTPTARLIELIHGSKK